MDTGLKSDGVEETRIKLEALKAWFQVRKEQLGVSTDLISQMLELQVTTPGR